MLELIKNGIWDFRFVIIVAIAFAVVFFLFERERGINILLNLMFQAKRKAKDMVLKSGEEQVEWVVDRAMFYMPNSWKLIFGRDKVKQIVKWLFDRSKDYFDDGKFNNSIGGW